MDAAERMLLEETVGDVVAAAVGAGERCDDGLRDLGWLEMLAAEPRDAVEIVFTALGRVNGVAGVLDDVLATALGVTPHPDLAVLLPEFGRWDAPDREGLMTVRAATASDVLVVGRAGMATVPISALEVTAVRGADPAGGLHRARLVATDAPVTPLVDGAWDAAVAVGRRALGHQIVGGTRTALDLACTHARDRVQFGRPVGGFQAVRHRLADALVAIEALVASLGAAWDDGTPMTSALAKAVAGRTARTVAAQCQQVLAGIGFTTDHPFHLYLKRTMVLEGLFGTADEIVLDLGRTLVRNRHAPTLIEL